MLPRLRQPPTPRTATPIQTAFAKTWDAVFDVFSDRNISIRTIERTSGLIATDRLTVQSGEGLQWADCGTHMSSATAPEMAVYNVLVRGDSTQSTVKVTASWTATVEVLRGEFRRIQCVSKGVWENDLEAMIRARAEVR